ncbi:MAG: glycogen synthase GlgA [Acidobacteria bacterium]|nr:MAG: glycogen synthase GlgA [Acidobacteriota bacterium]
MKIVFVASEGVPYSKTGGLADVVGALPKALASLGYEVEVFLPRYKATRPGAVVPGAGSITVPLSGGFKFASIQIAGESNGVRTYLMECPELFDRDELYMEKGKDYPDNAERFAAFSMAALEFMKRLPAPPAVIHCHDWQSALVPVYLRSLYEGDTFYKDTSVLFTIHNIGYQGLFPPDIMPRISINKSLFKIEGLEYYGKVNLLKGGIVFSDFVSTVSQKYAQEIQTDEFGHGLEGVLRGRADRLTGILNGVDYDDWNPATDKLIPANYTPENMKGKEVCKKALLQKLGVQNPVTDRPVLGIVSRFVRQKGFDLIAQVADELMREELYITALGTGEPEYEELFRSFSKKYPDKFLVRVAYDNTLAHQIEAGADMFLMPSRYEPCGLNQIYSMKYGTVPVVRATGGLDDTVQPFDGEKGTGFRFRQYSPVALLACLQRAIATFRDSDAWSRLQHNCMQEDFSWSQSAGKYASLYESLYATRAERAISSVVS